MCPTLGIAAAICQMPNTRKLYFYSVPQELCSSKFSIQVDFLHSLNSWRMFTQRNWERERERKVEQVFTFGQLGSTSKTSRNLISSVSQAKLYGNIFPTFFASQAIHPSCGFYFCLCRVYENLILCHFIKWGINTWLFWEWIRRDLWELHC